MQNWSILAVQLFGKAASVGRERQRNLVLDFKGVFLYPDIDHWSAEREPWARNSPPFHNWKGGEKPIPAPLLCEGEEIKQGRES